MVSDLCPVYCQDHTHTPFDPRHLATVQIDCCVSSPDQGGPQHDWLSESPPFSGKMAASSRPHIRPAHLSPNPAASPWFLIILLLTLVILPSSETCGEPPRVENMKPTGNVKPSYDVGERVNYTCNPGYLYRPPKPKFVTCGQNQQWSQIAKDTCYKKSCRRQDDIPNGVVNLINGSYEFGNQIEFVCHDGFHLIGARILHCQLTGSDVHWSNSPPHCEKIVCAPPPDIANGTHNAVGREVFEYLSVVTYRCHKASGPDEFSLVGESQLHCAGSGKWSSDPPQCKVVKCPFPSLTNGRQTSGFGKKFYYKAQVTFECNQGFYLHGNSLITCAEDNTWKPPPPTCRKESPPPTTRRPSASSPPSLSSSVIASSSKQPPASVPSRGKPRISNLLQYYFPCEGSLSFRSIPGWIITFIITVLELQ